MKIPWYLMAKGKGGGTKTASGPIAHWTDGVAAPLRSLVANIEPVQAGSGDPSPGNVRPISGHTSATVTRTGVNVWDEEWENGYFSFAGVPSASTTAIRSKNFCSCVGGLTYYYYFGGSAGITYILWYDSTQTMIGSRVGVANATVTAPSNAAYFKVCTNASYGTTYNNDISINYPSTDHEYHPYSGNQYTIQLGQTVYGAMLDVTNGVLTVDKAMVTFDGSNDEAWNDYSNYNGYYIQLNAMKSGNRQDGWSNMLKDSKTSALGQIGAMWLGVNNSKNFFVIGVHDTMGATLSAFRSYLSEHPLELVYPLATPITIPITPQEISTLQGQNNLWADTGDVTVEYLSAGGANPDLMKLAVAFMGRR